MVIIVIVFLLLCSWQFVCCLVVIIVIIPFCGLVVVVILCSTMTVDGSIQICKLFKNVLCRSTPTTLPDWHYPTAVAISFQYRARQQEAKL